MKKFNLAAREISTDLPAFIMGIVNCTPDSFFEKSRGAEDLARKLIDEGADILDIGGESTRPGSSYIDEEEEIRRIIPVIEKIRKFSDIPISVDTRKMPVMKAAFEAGADIVNDISAFEDDERMASFAADKKLPVILMHKRGIPTTMDGLTDYSDVVKDVSDYLEKRADFAMSKGIEKSKIIVDPGVGFGKDCRQNSLLTAAGGDLCGGKYPVLMAISRKRFLGEITGRDTEERLVATVSANLISVINGSFMVRVHDVAPCRDSLMVLKSLQ